MRKKTVLSVAGGLAITFVLLLVMQLLVAAGEDPATEPGPRVNLKWLKSPPEPEPVVDPPPPRRIDPPQLPPETKVDVAEPLGGQGIGVTAAPPQPQPGVGIVVGAGVADGPLINILKVEPQYPPAAAVKGIEGLVIVEFDVNAAGTVENVVIVESTDRVFNRAAVAAASQFKYKPRIVDGVPQGVQGVRQKFRFDLNR